MGKILIVFLLLSSYMLFGSCSMGGRKMIFDDDDTRADARMERLVDAIENKDRDAIKSIFSERAKEEASDFDGDVDVLFEFIQGSVVLRERDALLGTSRIDYGKKSVKLAYRYTVTTDNDKYLFYVIDYTQDTIAPKNAGLFAVRVIKAEDDASPSVSSEELEKRAGIYIPNA
jgi:hypothetical protein